MAEEKESFREALGQQVFEVGLEYGCYAVLLLIAVAVIWLLK
jgi:hypothetical protein